MLRHCGFRGLEGQASGGRCTGIGQMSGHRYEIRTYIRRAMPYRSFAPATSSSRRRRYLKYNRAAETTIAATIGRRRRRVVAAGRSISIGVRRLSVPGNDRSTAFEEHGHCSRVSRRTLSAEPRISIPRTLSQH